MSVWLVQFLIAVVPLALLLAALLVGRYPGELAIDRWRQAIRVLLAAPRKRTREIAYHSFVVVPFRGGRLNASSLAGRGPPARGIS